MRIEPPRVDDGYVAARCRELEEIAACAARAGGSSPAGRPAQRPCRGCSMRCPECESRTCTCRCSAGCAHAPRQLSSDAAFPVEPAIVPLVFGLAALGVAEPCWSCEGHADTVTRLPQVWFYARHQVLPRLIGEALADLKAARDIRSTWAVMATFSPPQSAAPAFAIRPLFDPGESADLAALQRDARAIGAAIRGAVHRKASAALANHRCGHALGATRH